MRRLLTPPVVFLAGLTLALAGCSGESPTSPSGSGGGSGTGACALTVALDATSVSPLAGTAIIVRATVKKSGAAVPDGTSVVFTTDFGIFLETGLPSVSKVTSNGFADVTLGATASGSAHVKAVADCASATLGVDFASIPTDGPYVSSISPLTGSCLGGDTVTINGGRLVTSLAVAPRVTFGGSQATIVSSDASKVVVLTPSRNLADASVPETVDVVVTVNPGTGAVQTTAPRKFTYTCLSKRTAITSVNPNLGRQEGNEPVTISGANFLPSSSSGPATTRVTFGGVPASITSQTDTILNVTTPRHALANASIPETVDVVATVDLGLPTQQSASLLRSFTYYASGAGTPCGSDPRLYISQIVVSTPTASPGSPDGGDVVTISGGGFWFGSSAQPSPLSRVRVEFGGVQAQVTGWSDSVITVISPRYTLTNPDAPLAVDVKVTVDVGGSREACVTATKGYTYFPGTYADIYITSLSPSTGPNDASTRVTIFGKNFRFPSQVFVGVAEATVVSISSTQIVFMTPTATGANAAMAGTTQQVQVRDTYSGKTVVSPVPFRYYACPNAGTAAPATAAWNVSTPVTISGHAFEEPVEAVFSVNGSSFRVNVISVSSSAIVVQMPVLDQLVGTGNISCADAPGTIALTFPGLACAGTISVPFTYQINRPTIASVAPQSAIGQATPTTVSVSGSNFVDPMEVEIVGSSSTTVRVRGTVGSSQSLSFVTPSIPDAAFLTESCQVAIPNDGERRLPTWMMLRVISDRTACTAQLGNTILFAPTDGTCRLRAPSIAVSPASVTLCTAASGVTYAVTGGTPPYTISASGLPTGLTAQIAGSTASVVGTASLAATGVGAASTVYPVTFTVTDSTGKTGTGSTTVTVLDPAAPFAITGNTAQSMPIGGGETTGFTATPGPNPFTPVSWSIKSISPSPNPGAITLKSSTGQTNSLLVSATVPAGTYTVTLLVRDTPCGTNHHETTLDVAITAQSSGGGGGGGAAPTITNASGLNTTMCSVLAFSFGATGGTPPYTWSAAGALPAGVSFDGTLATSQLYGTPQLAAAAGPYPASQTYVLAMKATDSVGASSNPQNFTLTVSDPYASMNILGPTSSGVAAAGGSVGPFNISPIPPGSPVAWVVLSAKEVGLTPVLPSPIPVGWFNMSPGTGNSSSMAISGTVPDGTYDIVVQAVDNICGPIGHKVSVTIRVVKGGP